MQWATAMEIFRRIGTQLMVYMVYREGLFGTGLIRRAHLIFLNCFLGRDLNPSYLSF